MSNLAMQQEQFVADRDVRNRFISRIEVLDKVKALSLLPDDEYSSIKMVSDYYETNKTNIDFVLNYHKDEFESDGVKMLSGESLRKYKSTHLTELGEYKRVPRLTLLPRRAILRVGMLLRDSSIAKQVRTYLIDVEEQATQQQKEEATRGSTWDKLDLILYDIIVTTLNNNGTLTEACEIASERIGKTVSACKNRYSSHIKKKIQNEELVKKIRNNKGRAHLRLVRQEDELTYDEGIRPTTWQELMFNEIVQMNMNTNEMINKLVSEQVEAYKTQFQKVEEEILKKDQEIKRWKNNYARVNKELKQVQAVVASAIKINVNEELATTFRMDQNGNLERI